MQSLSLCRHFCLHALKISRLGKLIGQDFTCRGCKALTLVASVNFYFSFDILGEGLKILNSAACRAMISLETTRRDCFFFFGALRQDQ